jgi:hypothetical protein
MNETSLIKRIRQVESQIKALEEVSMDETLRKQRIEENKELRKYYTRLLKDLKWKWILGGNTIETILN